MKKSIIWAISALTFGAVCLTSCSDTDHPKNPAESYATVQNVEATVEGRNVVLTWTLPSPESVTGIQIINGTSEIVADLEGAVTTYTVKRAPVGETTYTVKAKYGEIVSYGQTVKVNVVAQPAKVGYLIAYDSVEEIEDDDEQASCEWFRQNYGSEGVVLFANSLPALYPDDYSSIMIHIDRKYIGMGWENLPEEIISDEVLDNLRNYVKEGGNLVLWTHATQLVVPLGRVDAKYAPTVFGDGDGGMGSDNWCITAIWGAGFDTKIDRRNHVLWTDIEICNDYNWETYPMIGTGNPETSLWREDHNCMWDPNAMGFAGNGSPGNITQFETALNCTAIGTWGHVADYCCVAVVDFKPNGNFLGHIVGVGGAAFEWNANEGENVYRKNIEQFAKNALSYK